MCVDGVADEETHVGGDLFVAAAAGVELEGEGADLFGELELDEVVDVFGLFVAADVFELRYRARGLASIWRSSSLVRMPAAAMARAWAMLASTSWGRRR